MKEALAQLVQIVPTYNERENIAKLIEAIFTINPTTSVLVVDDNSPDGTAQVVRDLCPHFPGLDVRHRIHDRGFGKSYIDGFKQILNDDRYEYIVTMDADFSHDPRAVAGMLKLLVEGKHDAVIGSRYVTGGAIENWQLRRKLLSRFANRYAKTIMGLPINDITAGFICFRKDSLKKLNLDTIQSEGYAFLVEFKYKLIKAGCSVAEYPITFTERREGQSKMSAGVIWESIWMPWRLRLRG